MAQKVHPYADGAKALARRLIDGAPIERRGAATWEVDAAGSCEAPVGFSHTYRGGFGSRERARRARDGDRSLFIEGDGRCRRCQPCLAYRRGLWRARAATELAQSSRTWWGTLTQAPHNRWSQLCEAKAIAYKSLVDYDAETAEARFQRLVRVLGGRVQRYLKRLRKQSGARLRYLLVAEPHLSGDPHIHILLHEVSKPVRKAVLEAQWTEGFSKWTLVGSSHDDHQKVASYITKYMLKEACARPRASLHYGNAISVVASELPEKAASSPTRNEVATNGGDDLSPVPGTRGPRPLLGADGPQSGLGAVVSAPAAGPDGTVLQSGGE